MTTKALRSARIPRREHQGNGEYVILPRSQYAHLRRYNQQAGYVVDAIEFSPLPVPEPFGAALLPLCGLVILRRRRSKPAI